MASDYRVAVDPIFDAFGVPVTVTRPAPDSVTITTVGVWVQPLSEEQRIGVDASRREPRKVLALQRAVIAPPLPRNTIIAAPEVDGGPVLTWQVDGIEQVEADIWRVSVRLG
jgi:hypothetical protein